jgi:hypothetical protein
MDGAFHRLIDEIPWSSLQDAYGSAEEIRDLICRAAFAEQEPAEAAMGQIYKRICHQDKLEKCAPAIVPAIIELLNVEDLKIRPFVLQILFSLIWSHVANLGMPGVLPLARDFEPKSPFRSDHVSSGESYRQLSLRTYSAIEQGSITYVRCLGDREPAVRANAAHLLAFLNAVAVRSVKDIRNAYRRETDVYVQATALLCLGALSGRVQEPSDLNVFEEVLDSPELVLRCCGAIASVYAQPHATASDRVWSTLEETAKADRILEPTFPWSQGAIAGLASEALAILGRRNSARATEHLLAAIRYHCARATGESLGYIYREWPLPLLVAEHLVSMTLNDFKGRAHEVLCEELSPEQIRVLTIVGVECGVTPWAQRFCGIPLPTRDLPRFLGMAPRGPLDSAIDIIFGSCREHWPIWKWWRILARGQIEESTLVDAILYQLNPTEVLMLCQDMASGAYDPSIRGTDLPVPLAMTLIEKVGPQLIEELLHYADQLLESGFTVSQAAFVMVPLLRYWRERGKRVDRRYRDLIRRLTLSRKYLGTQIDALLPAESEPF